MPTKSVHEKRIFWKLRHEEKVGYERASEVGNKEDCDPH
jgi:hypothetical protein